MAYTPIEKLIQMKPNARHNLLAKQHKNPEERARIAALAVAAHEAQRVEAIKKTQQAKLWAALIHQLVRHRPTATGQLKRRQAELDAAPEDLKDWAFVNTYTQYIALLDKLRSKLHQYKDTSGKTPAEVANEKGIPNNGRHWVDWVPHNIRVQFTNRIEEIYASHVEKPMELFTRKPYTPPKKRPSQAKPLLKRVRDKTAIELLRDRLTEADTEVLRATQDFTYGDLGALTAQRDALIEALAEAKREKNRRNALRYYHERRAEMQAWRDEQKKLGNI
jgi:hypothetical protein